MAQTYIGAPIRRREDVRFLTGTATFVDDIKLPHMLYAAILRSPHAHARVTAIETSQALTIPGVVAVFTCRDVAPYVQPIPIRLYPLPGLERFLQYPLASDKVRYVGEAVAVAVATSRYVAEDALDALAVHYEPLPAVVHMADALRDETVLHEAQGTNLAAQYTVNVGDIEAAWQSAEPIPAARPRASRPSPDQILTTQARPRTAMAMPRAAVRRTGARRTNFTHSRTTTGPVNSRRLAMPTGSREAAT